MEHRLFRVNRPVVIGDAELQGGDAFTGILTDYIRALVDNGLIDIDTKPVTLPAKRSIDCGVLWMPCK